MVRHLGFILDGNRRFAKKHGLLKGEGHKKGAEKVKQLIEWSKEHGIKELTLYVFSTENFSRPEDEKQHLFDMFRKAVKELRDKETDIAARFVGRLELFPKDMQDMMHEVMKKTENNDSLKVNFAVGYGGRQEIIDAVNKVVKNGLDVTEENIMKNLYITSEPELIIRTGNSVRCSNFLMFQSAYTELHFSPKLLPEFEKEDFVRALQDYEQRTRNFGK